MSIEKFIDLPNSSKIAVADCVKSWTYKELNNQVYRATDKLKNIGIKAGMRVMLRADSCVEFVAFYLALHNMNAICIPYSKGANSSVISRIQTISHAEFNLHNIRMYKNTEVLKYDTNTSVLINDNDIADILFTSGTTGTEKGVVLNKTAIKQAICNISIALSLKSSDIVLLPMPLHHSHALGTLRALLHNGATAIIADGIGGILDLLFLYPCTGISCSPVMAAWLIKSCGSRYEEVFRNLRFVEIGTAPLVGKNRKKVKTFFSNVSVYVSYGATEAPRAVYMNISEKNKDAAIGKTVGDYKVKIFALDNEEPVKKGERGRLGLSGKALMSYYLNDKITTKKAVKQGFFLTGDVAYIDSEDDIVLVDRVVDLLIIGGEKVYPSEIENMINQIEYVESSVCIGIKTEKFMMGQKMVAFVKKNKQSSINEQYIRDYLKRNVESYKVPSQIIFVDKFPRNEMGKIDKIALSKMGEIRQF